MHHVFTIATNIRGGVLKKKTSETFKQNPCKIPQKNFIFSKVTDSKNDLFTRIFLGFC